jgi:hypothetical protein
MLLKMDEQKKSVQRPWAGGFPAADQPCGCLDQKGKLETAACEDQVQPSPEAHS